MGSSKLHTPGPEPAGATLFQGRSTDVGACNGLAQQPYVVQARVGQVAEYLPCDCTSLTGRVAKASLRTAQSTRDVPCNNGVTTPPTPSMGVGGS